jgi:glycosyltransferase involved in cell wall biosynthesis
MESPGPRLLVFATLFPHPGQPNAGVFIRERMFRVGRRLPLAVVAPCPWFPFQSWLRRWKPNFRPDAPPFEEQDGFAVYHPRFFSVPGLCKSLDGFFMALGSYWTVRKLAREFRFDIIDAHFAYPDGYAAALLGRRFGKPVTITLRGTEVPLSKMPARAKRMARALRDCSRIFSVSESLKSLAVSLGIPGEKIRVVGNGVDSEKFHPVDRQAARASLGIPADAKVLVSVGALVPRKGFHRVIEILPALLERHPDLLYLVVGGSSPEGDIGEELKRQAARLGVAERMRFLGAMPSAELKTPLSAADVFVLSTSNEGWANVFLEAMACGLPVVTTDVGGNREVVRDESLGRILPFGDANALREALDEALKIDWDRQRIRQYAEDNDWDRRVEVLVEEFTALGGR